MSKRPLVYWNILGEGARKASNANIDTSPKITINFLEEVGALQEVVGDAVVCRFSKSDRPRSSEAVLDAFTHVANEPVDVFNASEVADLMRQQATLSRCRASSRACRMAREQSCFLRGQTGCIDQPRSQEVCAGIA